MASAPRDENREAGLIAKSDADNTLVVLEADPATKRLKVSAVITSGGSAGTQYTDGDAAVSHPIGTIPVYNNAGTITAVSAANPLPVSATISTAGLATSTKQSDGSQKTQVVDGSGNVIGSTSNALDVNVKSGTPTVTQGTAAAVSGGWPVIGGELADTTGTFTNGTQTTSVTSNSFDGYSTVIVSVNGTYGTATGVFEVSDDGGTTWYSVNAARSDGTGLETGYTSLTNTNRMWTLSVSGADEFRVRSTAVVSGTVNVRLSVESMPTPEAASVSAYLTDGVNTANILKSDGTATGQNSALVSGTGMGSGTLTLNLGSPATSWYDMINYPWVSIEVLTNASAATLTFQTSGDASQTNIRTTPLQDSQNLASPTATSTSSATTTLHGPRTGRYFRISSNVSGANTVTLVITFYTSTSMLQTFGVQAAQSGAWTVGSSSATGSAVPANAFYAGISDGTNLRGILGAANALNSTGTGVPTAQAVGQFDDVSPTSITENQFGNLRMSANRNAYTTIRDAAGNERGVNVNASNQMSVSVDNSPVLGAGSALVGKVGIDQTTPGTTNAVVDTPVTSGGLLIVTGSVGATATAIKASAGQLYGYHLFNTTAAVAYVQIFNVAAASVTLNTTVPTFSIGIPASGGVTVNWDKGIAFSTAISYACTTTRTGLTGATCDVNFFYK